MSITTGNGITKNKISRTLKDQQPQFTPCSKNIFKQSFKLGHKIENLFDDPFGFDFVHITGHRHDKI